MVVGKDCLNLRVVSKRSLQSLVGDVVRRPMCWIQLPHEQFLANECLDVERDSKKWEVTGDDGIEKENRVFFILF